jgi:GntR family transcriptional regulator/MocR family aminotransferase
LVPVDVPADADGIDIAEGQRIAPTASLAVVTPTVQFPTGLRMSNKRRHQLLEWSRGSARWILEIDHQLEFPLGREDSVPLASMPNADRVVYFDNFSKLLFPALRLSFIIVPRSTVARFETALSSIDRAPDLPNQIVLADFLGSKEFAKHLRRCRQIISERRAALLDALHRELGALVTVDAPQAGLFVCARLPPQIDDVALVEAAQAQGIALRALSSFYAPPRGDRGILLGYAGHTPEELRSAVQKLAKIIDESSAKPAATA